VDDYYEEKVLADITEKGLKPGDLVGELADPNAPSAAALAAAELANAQKGDRSGGTQGIYRAGGPTTLFGGPGWGPYSDGPLNAVRKSLLNRDGLNEENWMLVASQRTAEANADWSKQRRRALAPYGGIFGPVASAPQSGKIDEEEEEEGRTGAGAEGSKEAGKEVLQGKGQARGKGKGQEQEEHERVQGQRENDSGTRRRKRARREEKVPRGVYEPHSGIVLCMCSPFPLLFFHPQLFFFFGPFHDAHFYRPCLYVDHADTQPTQARWEGLKDSAEKRQVLGGTKAGNGAWALAWVDTVMEAPAGEEDYALGHAAAEERRRLLELAAADLNS
jgi:chromatin structure-remodeling complex protein RSC7